MLSLLFLTCKPVNVFYDDVKSSIYTCVYYGFKSFFYFGE